MVLSRARGIVDDPLGAVDAGDDEHASVPARARADPDREVQRQRAPHLLMRILRYLHRTPSSIGRMPGATFPCGGSRRPPGVLVSACFRAKAISSSVYLDLFMSQLLVRRLYMAGKLSSNRAKTRGGVTHFACAWPSTRHHHPLPAARKRPKARTAPSLPDCLFSPSAVWSVTGQNACPMGRAGGILSGDDCSSVRSWLIYLKV